MKTLSRRKFLGAAAGCTLGAATWTGLPHRSLFAAAAKKNAASARRHMRITDVEIHETLVPFHNYNAKGLLRYHGPALQYRTVFIVKTDVGLEGYGEAWGRRPGGKERAQKYVGTDPFDWIGDPQNLYMNMAIYDLMGKYLGIPVWKLIGPKVRDWMPVAAWTVSRHPDELAEEVVSVAQRGYHWIKYHVDVLQNVVDQAVAMQAVAPPGFKVHFDFNGHQSLEQVYPVLKELEKLPIAGRVEDPVTTKDREAYRILREKCKLSILVHHGPTDYIVDRLCDGYMAGHAPIGLAMHVSALANETRMPFMLQQAGGTINQAFLAHECAVFKMATIDAVNLAHLWKDEYTNERMPVIGGSVQVPKGPGLGVTVDREKLARYTNLKPEPLDRYLVRVRYKNGLTVYFRHDPTEPGQVDNLRAFDPPFVPGPSPSYGNAVVSDFWDDYGDPKFERIWKESESGPVSSFRE